MRVDDLIAKLEEHKERYGNTLVRYSTEIDNVGQDFRIESIFPCNINTQDHPMWVAMLSD